MKSAAVARLVGTVLAIVSPLVALAPLRAQSLAEEHRVKAAFIHRFPEFVQWPRSALDGRKSFELCVLGDSPIRSSLDELADDAKVGERPLIVRAITAGAPLEGCHLLFIAADAATPSVMKPLRQLPVLTVSDSTRFLDAGGIIQLRVVGNRVRFDINAGAADQAGLRISAQLLRLAVTVRGGAS